LPITPLDRFKGFKVLPFVTTAQALHERTSALGVSTLPGQNHQVLEVPALHHLLYIFPVIKGKGSVTEKGKEAIAKAKELVKKAAAAATPGGGGEGDTLVAS